VGKKAEALTQWETGGRMIGWGHMPEANFPVSGLPLSSVTSLANWSTNQRVNLLCRLLLRL